MRPNSMTVARRFLRENRQNSSTSCSSGLATVSYSILSARGFDYPVGETGTSARPRKKSPRDNSRLYSGFAFLCQWTKRREEQQSIQIEGVVMARIIDSDGHIVEPRTFWNDYVEDQISRPAAAHR